ncbi:hypothetical protein H2204_001687 [Knufia peltigerae]|uniref:Xylanolytic transcriptional activator regulatory domain-containing protein n=1 Tax=Knufia peltigerae TaxID=1002370 RepID=A0AA38YCR0_9EURO|nr:hypothetical protein H2204_001687 [Knufia peltigerae]
MAPAMPFQADGSRPTKRQKTALACSNCRARKVRFCVTCVSRKETSTCEYIATTVVRVQEARETTTGRLDRGQSNDGPHYSQNQNQTSPTPLATRQSFDWNGNTIVCDNTSSTALLPNHATSSTRYSPSPRSIHSISNSPNVGRLQQGELGLSSSGGFLQTLLPGADTTLRQQGSNSRPPSKQQNAATLATLGMPNSSASYKASGEDFLLPSRKELHRLLDIYRKYHYPMYPLLDLPRFMSDVETIYLGTDSTTDQRTLHCLLNFMFALATQSHQPPDSSDDDPAAPYFTRARNLLSINILDGWSFAQLQTTLICAQFLLSTDRPQQCWLMVSLSARIAECLGLNRVSILDGLQDDLERSLSKRVWHCCVLIDRAVAMCLGQAPIVSLNATSYIKLDDDVDSGSGSRVTDGIRADRYTAHTFFKASSELFDVLHEILLKVYVPEAKPQMRTIAPDSFVSTVTSMEEKLARWEDNLPRHLKISNTSSTTQGGPYVLCQAQTLRQRYLQVCIMLYRPGLAELILADHDSSRTTTSLGLKQSTLLYITSSCLKNAQEMVGLCKAQINGHAESTMLTPWWMNILYIYTAATTIAVAMHKQDVVATLEPLALNHSMEDALGLLTQYSVCRPSARRCLSTLTSIAPFKHPVSSEYMGAADTEQLISDLRQQGTRESRSNTHNNPVYDMTFPPPPDSQNSILDFLSEGWLSQPQLDSFDFLGI